MAKVLGKQSRVGILRQQRTTGAATAFAAIASTDYQWTNPGVAASNYRSVYYNSGSVIPNPDVNVDQYNITSQNGIHTEYERRYVDATSGMPTLSFAGPVDKNTLAPHLIAALQAVSEGAGTPYEKTITCGGLAAPIDFRAASASAAGYLHTLAVDVNASADDGLIFKNCILNNFTFSFDFNNRGIARLAQMAGTWISNDVDMEQTLSGTWVAPTLEPLNTTETYSCSTLTIDSVAYATECIRRFDFAVNNNATSNCRTTGGAANQWDITPDYRSTIILDYNSATEKLLMDFQSGARVQMVFASDVSSGVDKHLSITGSYGILQSNPFVYNSEYIGIALETKFYSNGGLTPLTVLFDDTLDWGYE